MVEGIVFEVKRDFVIVMTKSGEFKKLKKKGTIKDGDIYRGKIYINPMRYYAAAAFILFIITSFTGYNAYAHQIVGYVDINGTKHVRLYINRLGNVQKSEGLPNGESIKNLSLDDAVKHIVSLSKDENTTLQDVQFKEIKPSKFSASDVEKKVKDTLSPKNTSSSKGGKNDKGTSHSAGKMAVPADNKNKLNNNGNNSENTVNAQSNNPQNDSSEKDKKNDKSENSSSDSSDGKNSSNNSTDNNKSNSNLDKNQSTVSKESHKNTKGVKINGHNK